MSSPDLLQHAESFRAALEQFLKTVLGKTVPVELGTPGRPGAVLAEAGEASLLRPRGEKRHWAVYLDKNWVPVLSEAMVGETMSPDQAGSGDLLCEVVSQGYAAVRQFLSDKGVELPEAEVEIDSSGTVSYGDSAQAMAWTTSAEDVTLQGWLVVQPEAADGEITILSQLTGTASESVTADGESVAVAPARFPDLGPETLSGGDGLPANFELMAEVQLELTVELGRRSIPLADILRLTTGSVIELEKLVGEPLEVYANGRLIAEGEAVVIDEQFGIRVTRLASVRQRARALS